MSNYVKYSSVLTVLFTLISVIQLLNCSADRIYDLNKKSCARVYTEISYYGFSLNLKNMKLLSDLSKIVLSNTTTHTSDSSKSITTSKTWKNIIKSVEVEPNCRVQICTDTDFSGSCTWINTNESEFNSVSSGTKPELMISSLNGI